MRVLASFGSRPSSATADGGARARSGLLPGPAHHQQVVSEPDDTPACAIPLQVQPVQVDIGQQRADPTAWSRPGHLPPDLPVPHDPGAQDLAQEPDNVLAGDVF